jgi:hypothetical protein
LTQIFFFSMFDPDLASLLPCAKVSPISTQAPTAAC